LVEEAMEEGDIQWTNLAKRLVERARGERREAPFSSRENLNPTLHTAWLNNHALTLKINIAYVILVKNPVFYPYFPKNLL
jgi:hypothetical protein